MKKRVETGFIPSLFFYITDIQLTKLLQFTDTETVFFLCFFIFS